MQYSYFSCKAVFVDTDLVPARDSQVGDLVQNETEATLVHQVAETLIRSGVSAEKIGTISLYRSRINLLNLRLQGGRGLGWFPPTRSKGRDKSGIVL